MDNDGTIFRWLCPSRKYWAVCHFFPTFGRGNLKLPKIELKNFSVDLRDFFNF